MESIFEKDRREQSMENNEKDVLTDRKRKIYEWLEKHIYKWLNTPIILLLIGSGLIWGVQLCVLKKVDREEKALAKKYQILTEVSSIHTDYYQNMWNFFFGKIGKEDTETMRGYRERIQSTVARAKSIETQLPILFTKKETSHNWGQFLKIYHDAWYKLSREGLTEQELNDVLNKAEPYIDKVVRSIYTDLGYNKEEYDGKILQSPQATGDAPQVRTFSDTHASGTVVTNE